MKNNLLLMNGLAVLLLLGACQKSNNNAISQQNAKKQTINAAPPSDGPRATLRGIVENVTTADGKIYNAKDNTGKTMDCLKIIANPSGGYIGVYHTMINGSFKVNVASSTDLLHWTWIRELAGSNNGAASQPTIAATATGGFVMVWEQEPSNHLKFSYFNSWTDLQNGVVAKTFEAPRTLSTCAEGTPNIYSASSTSVDVGFHYFANCDVDRQARGTTNWTSWNASAQPQFDNAILYWGVHGNIGDRDGYLKFQNFNFGLIEGQGTKNDFGSWRCYLYDYQTGNADKLNIHTDGGSQAFANPTITALTVGGQPALVITQFIPSELSASGEAGELIYYKKL
ncbi:MAG: hypothetical protein AAGC65_15005 [Mucilaginibacter sp.]|uniref:hypothetical protein n=1 Tax=Mucilaginibacter sp. TaxID=1882438 RepID=UPI0031B3A3AE